MNFNEEHIQYLWERYLSKTATPAEVRSLFALFEDPVLGDVHDQISQALIQSETSSLPDDSEIRATVWHRINEERRALTTGSSLASLSVPHHIHFFRKWGWAAAILLLLGTGAYLYNTSKKTKSDLVKDGSPAAADILPGSNKAVLTLADGTTITLDSAANGTIAEQGNSSIVKLSNGEIRYDLKGVASGEVLMNKMTTPVGGQYQLTLPDGTKAWLNAASSITYPAVFVGKERKIAVTGEVYLEVIKEKARPFLVDINGKSLVEVLGTSFNINAYDDDGQIRTTLVDGSVKIVRGSEKIILKPGYQAIVAITGKSNENALLSDEKQSPLQEQNIALASANIEQVLAWKNGLFNFNGLTLKAMTRQLERWYNIQVKFEGQLPDLIFEGEMDRGVSLEAVLRFFTKSKIQYHIEGNTLIISSRK